MSDSEGDFSDELLELAGATEKKRKRTHKANSAKRRKADVELESENEPESEEDDANPYPLEGKYIDEADRQNLLMLSEIERENMLAQRLEEMQRIQDKRNLDQMLKAQREDADNVSKAAKRAHTSRGATKEKTRKLDELRAKRKAKDEKKRARPNSPRGERSTSPVDMEMSSEDEEDGQISKQEERDEWEQRVLNQARPEEEAIVLADLEKCRLGRDQLSKFCMAPWFEDYVKGAWVRFAIGADSVGEMTYRICEITNLGPELPKPYKLNDQHYNQNAEMKHGSAAKFFPMDKISNGPFTEREFDRLKKSCDLDKVKLPSKRALEKKSAQLNKIATQRFTETDVNAMLARKNELKNLSNPSLNSANFAMERQRLAQARTLAFRRQDYEEVAELDVKLEEYAAAAPPEAIKSTEDSSYILAKVNERNRKANIEAIRKAEAAEADRKRKRLGTPSQDSSARVKTVPRLFESTSRSETPLGTPSLRPSNGTPTRSVSPLPPSGLSSAQKSAPRKNFESTLVSSIEIDLGDF